MSAYYNEIDPYAAQWIRNLIAAGHIAPGVVDERSIQDVSPSDIAGFTQCHFFAGIAAWSLALRRGGWPDSRRIWTASCPCQPFSAAGEGAGFGDERHLWPDLQWLIEQCRPSVVIGEQVASKDAEPWIDLVQADMEGLEYAFGAAPFPSASVGAPHIRDRLYWVAHSNNSGLERHQQPRGRVDLQRAASQRNGDVGGLGNTSGERVRDQGCGADVGSARGMQGEGLQRERLRYDAGDASHGAGELADPRSQRRIGRQGVSTGRDDGGKNARWLEGHDGSIRVGEAGDVARPAGPTNGPWADADWLLCRDGKWRPVEPGTFPLAHGATSRVGRLRAYGNAINAYQAQIFIEEVMGLMPPQLPKL